MKSLYFDTRPLDLYAKTELCLTEDILMENAAMALEEHVVNYLNNLYISNYRKIETRKTVRVLIICGSGDNGADGLVLARRLKDKVCLPSSSLLIEPCVFQFLPPKSNGCKVQTDRAVKVGLKYVDDINDASDAAVIVDCLFGSGFHGTLDEKSQKLIEDLNRMRAYKIACDVPSGLDCAVKGIGIPFTADETVTMGAAKIQLYLDGSKDFTGKIFTAPLGLSDSVFEGKFKPAAYLLEKKDLKLPSRIKKNVHKGTFGHAAVISGTKAGASIMAASSALRFGAGLVSLVSKNTVNFNLPYELMLSDKVPENATAIAIGMGLGQSDSDYAPYIEMLEKSLLPVVIDADMFYCRKLPSILSERSKNGAETIITPHPREFSVLLANCGLADISAADIQKDRFGYAEIFCSAYKNIVLILKGSTPVIAYYPDATASLEAFFNPHGSQLLSKGGSGDVLSGLAAALLAQGWSAKDAAVNASLAHALASKKAEEKISSYAFTPAELIEGISLLEKQI